MTPTELDLLKVGVQTALQPIANLTERLFGGAVDEIGGVWKDKYAIRRQIRRMTLMQKLQAAIGNENTHTRIIQDDIAIPALEAASLIDDDYLLNTWAFLLANAADTRHGGIEPLFVRILSELSSREIKFLDALSRDNLIVRGLDMRALQTIYFDAKLANKPTPPHVAHFPEQEILYEEDKTQFSIMMDILISARLVTETRSQEITFSGLGTAFLRACQPPKK